MTVDYTDVAVSFGRTLTDSEVGQVNLWIGDARTIIAARLGDLTLLDEDVLDYVVREAVVLKLKRPDDAVQVAVSVDDATTSRTYEKSTGQVSILDEWWTMLSPANDSSAGFSTRPGFTADVTAADYYYLGWHA